MVGCLDTGYAIGLTERGAAVCSRMLEEDVPEDDVTAVDPALLEHLARGGFFQRVVAEPRVLSAYLHVTQRCNLACAGCYSLDEHRNRLADAPLADMKCAVEGLAAAGLSQLIISGGEPFLREDLPDIVEHAKRACGIASVTVLSNGTRMTEESLERLAPNVDCAWCRSTAARLPRRRTSEASSASTSWWKPCAWCSVRASRRTSFPRYMRRTWTIWPCTCSCRAIWVRR